MLELNKTPEEKEQEFFKSVIREYLKYGSVDEIFKSHNYELPISYPGLHRLVDKWGIIKAAGPNSKLSEAISFLHLLSIDPIPLERFYRSIPPSFQISLSTMHRILHNIKEGIVRRSGTALIMTPIGYPEAVLAGDDISTPRLNLGKPFGSVSLPMGFSRKNETAQESIMRVLQQEVFTELAVSQEMPDIIAENPQPFIYLDIADVKVAAYHLELPYELCDTRFFTSGKIINHRFLALSEIVKSTKNDHYRQGVKEIGFGFNRSLSEDLSAPLSQISFLNLELAQAFRYL